MKNRLLFWIGPVIALLWMVSNLVTRPEVVGLAEFSRLPVLEGGRIKPLDTVARTSLMILHGRQTLRLPAAGGGGVLPPERWLAEALFNAPLADSRPLFAINNPEVLALFGWETQGRKFFSFAELEPSLGVIDAQGEMAEGTESARRTPYQTAILNLRNGLYLYQRLKNSLRPAGAEDFSGELADFAAVVPAGAPALMAKRAGKPFDETACNDFLAFAKRYGGMAQTALLLPVPPASPSPLGTTWLPVGEALLGTVATGGIPEIVSGYASAGDSWRRGDAPGFASSTRSLTDLFARKAPEAARRATFEELFNRIEPFYQAMGLYVLGFLILCAFWLRGDATLRGGALAVIVAAILLHTFGLAARMWLQGRPPVTNLYSSAVFIGWGTALFGLFLERLQRDGIGAACSAVIGFVTLIIAQHLAGRGDTLEMLQAVLDTNIWLATHVVAITIGYSAMFLAGLLAVIYVVRGFFTSSLTAETARSLTRMIYGVLCFATLFSFVGTVLGGIWADQSWGRFWGWDPKENGALLIVLWCAVTLHARLGGYIRQRGLVAMALFGNVVTAFSWFGVNMLGVGLHSYGFMDKAVPWLAAFVGLQIALIALNLTSPKMNPDAGIR
jgi:ABC-type transport system involved in cytochrome c biogenesis permease subunit